MSPTTESALVDRLCAGDGTAFTEVVRAYNGSLLRLASSFVPSRAVAEEVVQETWMAVIRGLPRFERRSSLKTWITGILVNIAKTRGIKERRTVPMAALTGDNGPSVDPDRFSGPPGHGAWSDPPAHWSDLPAEAVVSGETFALVEETVELLPENQRWVVMLRDVEGWSSRDVCDLLGITEANQRVLLHRARSVLRGVLEQRLGDRT
jgi:RNA polymerase sigma-70 factor (ECF subfamily)